MKEKLLRGWEGGRASLRGQSGFDFFVGLGLIADPAVSVLRTVVRALSRRERRHMGRGFVLCFIILYIYISFRRMNGAKETSGRDRRENIKVFIRVSCSSRFSWLFC